MIIDVAEITPKELFFIISPLSQCQNTTVSMIKLQMHSQPLYNVWPTICKSAPEVKDIVHLSLYLTGLMSPILLEKSRNDNVVPVQYL